MPSLFLLTKTRITRTGAENHVTNLLITRTTFSEFGIKIASNWYQNQSSKSKFNLIIEISPQLTLLWTQNVLQRWQREDEGVCFCGNRKSFISVDLIGRYLKWTNEGTQHISPLSKMADSRYKHADFCTITCKKHMFFPISWSTNKTLTLNKNKWSKMD